MRTIAPPQTKNWIVEMMPPSDQVETKYAYLMIGATIVFFQILNLVVVNMLIPSTLTGSNEKFRYKNTFISWIHAVICGLWDLYCLIFHPKLIEDPLLYANYTAYLLVAFSAGYFIFDFFDFLVNGKMKMYWEVALHHVLVIWVFWYQLQARTRIGYAVIALMTEINSMFLHLRKLLQLQKWDLNHWFYKSSVIANLVSFVLCRGYCLPVLTYGIWKHGSLFTVFYSTMMYITMILMDIINPVLFWRLFRSDVLRKWKPKLKTECEKVTSNNNINHFVNNHHKKE